MKTVGRILFFTGMALYVTSLWNKGFILDPGVESFLKATLMFAGFYYIIKPVSKVVLLPINLLTLGLLNTVFFFILFYFFSSRVPFVDIDSWRFQGASMLGFSLPNQQISYPVNLVLSSASISGIIRLLEIIL